jgi:hypothetical protein
MAAPAASFTVIPLSDIDPDSPLTTGLMVSIRDNAENVFAQLVGDPVGSPTFTPAAEHDHDGVNSKTVDGANLVLIERKEIAADANTVDFAATLDGDTEKVYMLVGRFFDPGSTSSKYLLRANGAATGIDLTVIRGAGVAPMSFMAIIHALRTVQTISVELAVVSMSIAATPGVVGGTTSLGANLTSLGIVDGIGPADIKKGSEFTLYRLRQS